MRKLILLILFFISFTIKSQYNNNWQFGIQAGLNFSTTPPTSLTTGQSQCYDNNSSISDNNGNLLFYTDGSTVWDKNNSVMPNGSGLVGSFTAGQCAVIIPIPCSNTKYVIFHVTDFSNPGYLNYTVVDMSLNSGLGDVVVSQKNMSLGSGWTEKLCAYYDPTGNCYWLLTHKWMSNQFVAFKVDASTIATTSVVSGIGSVLNCGTVGGAHDAMGQLTISPDGSKVINALTCQDKFELFDFNSSTGALSNSISLNGNANNAFGTAFSSDSKKLYVSAIFGSQIFQYDLTSNNQSNIQSSLFSVYNTMVGGYSFGYLELGPDGKIYVPRPNSSWLSVVNSPNLSGASCTFSYSGKQIGSASLKWGLSRIAYNIQSNSASTFSLSNQTNSVSCFNLSNGSATIMPSPAGSYSYTWSPGNFTTQSVSSLSSGIYTVNVYNGCWSNSVSILVNQPTILNLIVSQPQTICREQSALLSSTLSGGTPAYSYTWTNGSNFSGTSVSPITLTVYTLTIMDANGCIANAVTTVSVETCDFISKNISENENLIVFPSQSNGEYNIKSVFNKIIKVECFNLLGQQIELDSKDGYSKLSIIDDSKGLFLFKIYTESRSVILRRVLKE